MLTVSNWRHAVNRISAMRRLGFPLLAFLAAAQQLRLQTGLFISGEDAGYVDSAVCAGCHRATYESYRADRHGAILLPSHSGKYGRGLSTKQYRLSPGLRPLLHYLHRAGRYYQRRHQIGPDGRERTSSRRKFTTSWDRESFSHLSAQIRRRAITAIADRLVFRTGRLLAMTRDMTGRITWTSAVRSIGNAFSATTLTRE